jgi:hypothetical protein
MVLYSESAAKKERDAIAEFEKKALSVQSEPKKPILEYNNRTWKSWVNLGIPDIIDRIPHNVEAPETRKKIFLSRVDLEQGPIQRKITMMVRRKAKNQGEDSKEYLVYYDDWFAKDWMGRKLVVSENIEGVYMEQEKEKIIRYNEYKGPEVVGEKYSGQHEVHYIEFSKEAVDKAIGDQNKSDIIFVVKIPPRRDRFTYDEFVNFSWDELNDILMLDGGAEADRAERIRIRKGQGSKVKTANKLDFKPS